MVLAILPSSMAKVVVFGVGQMAEVAHFYLTHDSEHEVVAFTVDRDYIDRECHFGLPVIPFDEIEASFCPNKYRMFLPVSYKGVNKARAGKYCEAKGKGYGLISYVSSKATTWPGLEIGDNCFIFENNVIQPYVRIGSDVIMWSGNHVGHHTTIKDHCFIASHVVISGSVVIEPYCFLGVNATIRDNITVARECVIGMGALITKPTEERGVYLGPQATLIPKRSDELSGI